MLNACVGISPKVCLQKFTKHYLPSRVEMHARKGVGIFQPRHTFTSHHVPLLLGNCFLEGIVPCPDLRAIRQLSLAYWNNVKQPVGIPCSSLYSKQCWINWMPLVQIGNFTVDPGLNALMEILLPLWDKLLAFLFLSLPSTISCLYIPAMLEQNNNNNKSTQYANPNKKTLWAYATLNSHQL